MNRAAKGEVGLCMAQGDFLPPPSHTLPPKNLLYLLKRKGLPFSFQSVKPVKEVVQM